MMLGTAKAKELEKAELDAAEKIVHPVPSEFRGIGVRIEDDILITESGAVNLTDGVPTDPVDIEALCALRLRTSPTSRASREPGS